MEEKKVKKKKKMISRIVELASKHSSFAAPSISAPRPVQSPALMAPSARGAERAAAGAAPVALVDTFLSIATAPGPQQENRRGRATGGLAAQPRRRPGANK